jgi:hypothetical protein
MCCTIRRRRKKSFGAAIKKVGEDASSELMKSINARVEAVRSFIAYSQTHTHTRLIVIISINYYNATPFLVDPSG